MIREAVNRRALLVVALLAAAGCGDVKSNKPDIGVKVGPLGGFTSESGAPVAFVVTLRTQPKAEVVLPFSSSDTSEAVVSSAGQIVFTREDWQSPHAVTVTGVDDAIADGHMPYEIVFGATQSADPNYNGLQIASLPSTNLDDEEVGFVVSPVSNPTVESGAEATFTISLTAQPEGIVSVPYASSDLSEGEVDGQSVEFTEANWNVPKTITITGIDDGTPDGNQTYAVQLGPTFSTDPHWDAIDIPPAILVNIDDDLPGITVGAATGATTEAGGTATFTVQLNSEPSANVIVSFATDDATEGDTDVTSLTFTTTNWATPQTVTVTGANDDAADGPISYEIDFMSTVSIDMAYAGLTPASVALINTDDENAAVTVFPVNGLTTETGTTSMFDVVLAAQPANDVVISVRVSNSKEASVSPSSITFTAMNWNVAVPVTVTGKNDFLDDGHKAYQLSLVASGDATYSALPATVANLTNVDDGPPASIVIYNDNAGTFADEAATTLGFTMTSVATQTDLVNAIASNPTIVVWEASTGDPLDPAVEPALTAFVSSGGRLVYSDVDLDGQPGMQAVLEVISTNPYTGNRAISPVMTLRGSIFSGANVVPDPLTTFDLLAADSGTEIALMSTSGTMAAAFNTTSGAIAITRGNMVIVNSFAPDDAVGTNNDGDGKPDMQELYENELRYLIDLPLRIFRQDFNTPTAIPTSSTQQINLPVTFTQTDIVNKAVVSFYITHTNDDDVDALLVAPDGTTTVDLVSDIGSIGDNFGTACAPDSARTTLDPAASTVPPDLSASAPFVGTWRPEGDMTVVRGMSAAGTWNFRVIDDVSGTTNVGTVQCWSLMLFVEESE